MTLLAALTTVAGVGMSFGYFAQTIRILSRKSANDVSLITYFIFGIGTSIWLIY